jgi:hypothetical protein
LWYPASCWAIQSAKCWRVFVMPKHTTLEGIITLIESGVRPPLIAIDGLPCSGKSTIVDRLRDHIKLDCIYLDDFVLPEREWPSGIGPAFPFAYIRYDEFLDAVQTLALELFCARQPWPLGVNAGIRCRRGVTRRHMDRPERSHCQDRGATRWLGDVGDNRATGQYVRRPPQAF